MKTIGITGGIGSGKSVLSKIMEIMGIPVYNSDREAKRITESSPIIREKLIDRFGPSLYKDGNLDRSALASIAFSDQSHLFYLNSIIHPEVIKDFLRWEENLPEKKFSGIESAILFESGLFRFTDLNITISAPEMLRIERTIKRDNLNKEAVLSRIKSQMPEEERNSMAEYVILNDNLHALIPQIEKILSKLNFQ